MGTMNRERTLKLIIAFATTTAAMAMEAACKENEGRLIPIPREISAGCGLAWCAEPEQEALLTARMEKEQIPFQEKRLIELF